MNKTIAAKIQQKIRNELAGRVLLMVTLAYAAGIVTARFITGSFGGSFFPAIVLLLIYAAMVLSRALDPYRAVILAAVSVAGGIAFFYAFQQPAGGLLAHTGTPLYIEGTVSEEPLFFEDHSAYRLKVEAIEGREGRLPVSGTLLVKIYGADRESYRYGEYLRMRGTITGPRGLRNPGGFDYRYYLSSQGIDALVYPHPQSVVSLGPGETNLLAASALKLRGALIEAIGRTLPSPSSELLAAILFGERHRLPEEVEVSFRRAGAGHLMAVSGLHVGLVAAMLIGFRRRLNLQGRLPLVLAIMLVIAYAYLTGLRPSALRAAIMISVALGALLLDREQDLPTAVAFAALATLFLNPLLLFTVGFQLSYAATLALIYGYKPLEHLLTIIRCPNFLRSALSVTLAAQLGVLPLCLFYFQALPAGALLFNLLLLPLVAFVIGLGMAGAFISLVLPLPGELLLWAAFPLLELMQFVTGWSNLPGFYISVYPPGAVLTAFLYALAAFLLAVYYNRDSLARLKDYFKLPGPVPGGLKPQIKKRFYFKAVMFFTLVLAVTIVWAGVIFPSRPNLRVTFIDVGQGASALIETPCGLFIMVDAGGEPAYRGDPGSIGEKVLLPFLRYSGVKKLDLAVITHPHEDHFGGFIPLVEELEVGRLLISPIAGDSLYYLELLDSAEAKGSSVTAISAGEIWRCGSDLVIEVVAPPEKMFRGTNSDLNNNSIVFTLQYRDVRMLFTGDIEEAAAGELLRGQADLGADLFLVPHHGGYMASMPALIERVKPSAAVIQVGVNSFGHPHPYVISALEEAGVAIYRNDLHGAVIAETDGTELYVTITEQPVLISQ
jgi:competence protein ComEC